MQNQNNVNPPYPPPQKPGFGFTGAEAESEPRSGSSPAIRDSTEGNLTISATLQASHIIARARFALPQCYVDRFVRESRYWTCRPLQ